MPGATFAHLTARSVVRVSGEDVHHFLQNLITADMDSIDAAGSGFGALLTPQGKILFDFLIFAQDGSYLLDTPRQTVADFIKRLTFYRLRAKVVIEDISETHSVFAVWGEPEIDCEPATLWQDPRVPALGQRLYGKADDIKAGLESAGAAEADHSAYVDHRISIGVPESLTDFGYSSIFPHDADMDALNGVSFSKGCYVGQEVVSRVHHRGTARKRFIQVTSDYALPDAGADIVSRDISVGQLTSSTQLADGTSKGIALARLDKVVANRSDETPFSCGGVAVDLAIPDWASFTWPDSDT